MSTELTRTLRTISTVVEPPVGELMIEAAARIEALEAALRRISEYCSGGGSSTLGAVSHLFEVQKIARAALAPEQDK